MAPWYRPFEPLEGDPRFDGLQQRLALDLQRQARNVERMLEGLDLGLLFAPITPQADTP